ncbi:IclR family transcriptional regulator [Aneurinibacillus sp. Ricciae_BoGa-3]|uniref:IclR family transcriptional regulator n=1 Tax=Aneurinibacillus sp. Ricciae_BoGa-3 TaxID=3022697 RepID=UPI0023424E64|nr:IclR family transcriptional regulator [Aneurinibacillus sp. Ricciae_BoGa-3]WCK52338.1 IclR family transcriptional regulator [Aneurinibacillus sp. Ricciae_BoGa-3]
MDSYSSLAAVERTLQVIEILIGKVDGVSVTEIVNESGLSKSMVSRILTTLKGTGYVEQDARTRFYKLSLGYISTVYRHINALEIEDIFYPLLERLAERTGELIQLTLVKEDGIYFVAKVEGSNPLKIATMLGRKAPLHATAAGKIWLASLSDEEVMNVIWRTGLKAFTEKTITTPNALLEEIAKIRQKGYSIANEEINEDIIAIAVPIYDHRMRSKVIASIVVAAPKFKMNSARIEELFEICKEETASFDSSPLASFGLGYQSQRLITSLNK